MSYECNYLSDDELDALLPDGVYDFEVVKADRKTSRSGNPMCALTMHVWDKAGEKHTIFDFLVFSTANMCIKKISRFSKSTGIYEEFKKSSLREDMVGLSGKVLIGTEDEMPRPSGGMYPRKNVVMEYLPESEQPRASTVRAKVEEKPSEFEDDTIPF